MSERLGVDLKVQRILKGVSQEKMVEDLNISRSKVSSWETDRREMSLYDAVIISDYFDVSMDNLFNKKALNSEQVLQIAKRYLENDKISLEEKKETLKRILYFKSEREAKEII
ncbi:dNA-binding helix-turn-helix protein [Clostridium sp. CAG:1219]|nr:dNA-binding helix-turn-helix protein [Clostridium sp. CAG:1219]